MTERFYLKTILEKSISLLFSLLPPVEAMVD